MTNMEESLLLPRDQDQLEHGKGSGNTNVNSTWFSFFEEVKKLGCIAGPMVAVLLSQYLLQIVSMMMVGHLGELALSSNAIAISLSGVTGFSLFEIFSTFTLKDDIGEKYVFVFQSLPEDEKKVLVKKLEQQEFSQNTNSTN